MFRTETPKNFDDLPKTGSYTTRKDIDEIGERQQLTTEAKRGLFYRVELLNEGKYRTRGEVLPDRRKRGKDGRRRGGGKARFKRVGNREREEKKGKHIKCWLQAKRKKKKKRKHEKKQKETSKGKKMKVKEICCKYVILGCLLFSVAKNSIKSY